MTFEMIFIVQYLQTSLTPGDMQMGNYSVYCVCLFKCLLNVEFAHYIALFEIAQSRGWSPV